MTELVQSDAEVIQRNICCSCVRLFAGVWSAMVTKGGKGNMIVPSQWKLTFGAGIIFLILAQPVYKM